MNQKDFKRIYYGYYYLLKSYTYNRIQDRSVAHDIVSDAFTKLWCEKPLISSDKDIRNYLIKCTRDSVSKYIKKEIISTELLTEHHNHIGILHDTIIDTEITHSIYNSLNNLSPRLKDVMELTIAGYKTNEISEVLGINPRQIRSLTYQARKHLERDLFTSNDYSNSSPHKQPESREQIIKIQNEVNEEFIKYYIKHPHKLYSISPRQYEIFVAELLKDMGYQVWLNNHTKDGGRDIIAVLKTPCNDSIVTLVECKKYSLNKPVPIEVVERFMHTIRDKDKANAGWIVTTSTFSREAQKRQHEYKWLLSLKDNKDLATLCSNYGKWKRTSEGSGLWLPDNPLG